MTDKEYKAEKARINKYWDKWFRAIGLSWWTVDKIFERELNKDSPSQAATSSSNWQYRTACITFVVPVCAEQDDEKLENVVVHEMTHILAAPIQDFRDDQAREITEYTVTTIAQALMWARLAGEGKKPRK